MKLKNYCKRFFTWNRHASAGFTLVELIVVIAILAILAGVGIPVYSGYITKANMQADMTLISEVANALSLGYYTGDVTKGGYVVLQPGAVPVAEGEGVADAMAAAFGDSWNTSDVMMLKHDGWNAEYTESSFAGKETVLAGKVEGLTTALGNFLTTSPETVGPTFTKFMKEELGYTEEDTTNSTKAADAAVLYVANATAGLRNNQTGIDQLKTTLATTGNVRTKMGLLNDFKNVYAQDPENNGSGYVMGAAATYAMFLGYIQYVDEKNNTNLADTITIDPSQVTDPTNLQPALVGAFGNILADLGNDGTNNPVYWDEYWNNQASKDFDAFVDAMGTLADSKDLVIDELQQDGGMNWGTSTTVADLYDAYSNGGVIIQIKADGTLILPEVN